MRGETWLSRWSFIVHRCITNCEAYPWISHEREAYGAHILENAGEPRLGWGSNINRADEHIPNGIPYG